MKRPILITLLLLTFFSMAGAEPDKGLYLSGRVKESLFKTDLTDAKVIMYNSDGTPRDTVTADQGIKFTRDGEMIKMSMFGFHVGRNDSTYVFDVICEGYQPQTITYTVKDLGSREFDREIPTIFLTKAPKQLKEVQVTATKIKFYNRGDTIVYNADAFELAEGSMLDALIAQLPGTELEEGGQIKVNGEVVESLLLNGKEFFDGNNELMLENIGAYTVKNIEVYNGQNRKEKFLNDLTAPKHLTMDVKLKKEYNMGWIINAQGGYGTEDRYIGRLFANWFNSTSRVTLVANFNNLNDNRKPGKNDSWTPERMPSGKLEYRMAGIDYDIESVDEKNAINGNLIFEQNIANNRTSVSRTLFLPGGNNYDNSFSSSRARDTKLTTRHTGYLRIGKEDNINVGMTVDARYRKKDNTEAAVSATFDTEQEDITMKAIEAIYSDGTPERLDAIINRSITRSDGSSKDIDLRVTPFAYYKLPKSDDGFSLESYFRYDNSKEELWKDYTINYGNNPVPANKLRQYFDNRPNRSITSINNLTYRMQLNEYMRLSLNYEYRFMDRDKDSYMYALDRLADMGVYGVIPSGYLSSFDPSNSFTSRLIENKHSFQPTLSGYVKLPNEAHLNFLARPNISLKHEHLDYWRQDETYRVRKSHVTVEAGRYDAYIFLSCSPYKVEGRRGSNYRHQFQYFFRITPKTPDLIDMVDVVNDADPLNVTEGNPNLRTEYNFFHELIWDFTPNISTPLSNQVHLTYNHTSNALTRGYTYDTSTGVRHIMTYNVGGNSSMTAGDYFKVQFGDKKQFSLSSNTSATFARYCDMIGTDLAVPTPSKVNSTLLNESANLQWQLGKQQLSLNASVTDRHTYSSQEGFSSINATHFNYGVSGQFKLPAGFGIGTDFTFYARRGYGVKELDTTDAIWNMRVTYNPPRCKRWVFMVDGFDMLHQLSNVNYAVNATGRTITYTNALPRYILFSAQYRLNIQPKKR